MGCVICKPTPIDFDAEVSLAHFDLLRSVGKGAFGKVRVVQHKQDKKHYALKYISKQSCIKMLAIDNILRERRLLVELENPFICNLRYAFQDDENLFMVLDLMLGGDLRFHLDRKGVMKENVVRFYVACISSALSHLHENRIVHRDLKPDNVLLCERGFAHVSDFNIATQFIEGTPLRSTAGSRAYMAPEILSQTGYFQSVDWWSLGVLTYEMLIGKRPFRGKTTEILTDAIKTSELVIPSGASVALSEECIDFLKKLICRDTTQRLGCCPQKLEIVGIREHPWFRGFDWTGLQRKAIVPPFIPDPKKSNFDATHELEELLLEENPLRHTRRRNNDPNRKGPPLSKEMQRLESDFTVFDYSRPVGLAGEGSSGGGVGGAASGKSPNGENTVSKTAVDSAHTRSNVSCPTGQVAQQAPIPGSKPAQQGTAIAEVAQATAMAEVAAVAAVPGENPRCCVQEDDSNKLAPLESENCQRRPHAEKEDEQQAGTIIKATDVVPSGSMGGTSPCGQDITKTHTSAHQEKLDVEMASSGKLLIAGVTPAAVALENGGGTDADAPQESESMFPLFTQKKQSYSSQSFTSAVSAIEVQAEEAKAEDGGRAVS